jgi:predicted NAD/FAD-binding protein
MSSSSRRSFLRKGALAAVGLGVAGARASRGAAPLPKVGIIGGGLAGVSCAWLLDGVAEAVLFESREILGGHAHTVPVDVGDRNVLVDVGAQFFAPGPHPAYSKLMELVGLTKPEDPLHDDTLESEMTLTVMGSGEAMPRFVSPAEGRSWPILAPWNRRALLAYFRFALAAKRLTRNGDWRLPLDQWLRSLPVNEEEREQLLLPIVSGTVGCSIEEARALSARSALVFIGLALPKNLLAPVLYRHSALGLGGNVRFLAGISGNLTTHVGSPVTRVERIPEGGFMIENALGVKETVDALVLATPPYVSRELLRELPGHLRALSVLDRFEFFRAEIAIHRDPVYMPENPRFWSAYNTLVDGPHSEASIWYGALQPKEPDESPLLLFKSWATARARPPEQEIVRRAFLHPLVTPDFLSTGRRLARLQGQDGVWFAGSYTREVDGQDTALLSAMSVVRELDPQAPNLLALESLLGT